MLTAISETDPESVSFVRNHRSTSSDFAVNIVRKPRSTCVGIHSTVYNWIEGGQLDRDLDNAAVQYTPRPAVACKIDAFQPIIDARLAEFPKLTATRLFDEIRSAGYDGGYTLSAIGI